MKYIVTNHFIDKDNIPYYVGDIYPYSDIEVSKDHIEKLLSGENNRGKVLIKANLGTSIPNDEKDINPFKDLPEEEEKEDDKKPRRRKSTKSSKAKTGDK